MTDGQSQLEEAVRLRLHEQAADVPAADAMRARVLAALENDPGSPQRVKQAVRDRNNHPFLLLAGIAAAVVIAVAFVSIANPLAETVEVVTTDPGAPDTAERDVQVDSERVQRAMALRSQDEAAGDWTVLSESERVLSIAFVSETDAGTSRILRIVTPPPGTKPDHVVASLRSTLFDTTLVDDSSGSIGGLASRVVRLETEAGTTLLGFKIASGTYVETTGTDRVFVVHIATSQAEAVVFWVEAPPGEIDEFEATAGRLIESLTAE